MADVDLSKPNRPTKKKKTRKQQYVSPDGLSRAPETERRLNEAFAIAFRGEVGKTVINYLRSISVFRAHEPGTDPNVVNQMEGARWLEGVIETRIKHGEEKKP